MVTIRRVKTLTPQVLKVLSRFDARFFGGCPPHPKDEAEWWIAYDGKTPVGFAGLGFLDQDKTAVLVRVAVLREFRGKGLHRRLISVREQYARKIRCKQVVAYTSVTNRPSMVALLKSGYEVYFPRLRWDGSWGHKGWVYFRKRL